ncbi:AAC(3) family N-acetyltransferase, partial [Aeromonas jandaei]
FNTLPVNCLIPAFNYQFPKLKKLDLRTAPIEVGSLNQYLHECNWADYRSFDPMFSVLGRGNAPFQPAKKLDAFGRESIFSYLEKGDGAVVMYGAKISTMTFLHYIESKIGGVPYRYQKFFSGELIDDHGILHCIEWTTHVRPWGYDLDYDWRLVENILRDKGVLQPLVNGYPKLGFYVDARACVDVLINELQKDPLIFLDDASRAWVEPKLNVLGRPFLLSDFENKE